MFDFSFSELIVVGAVALIVIGPERLPKVARTVGHLVGRLQRYVSDVKRDINREVELDELRQMRKEMNEAARSVETSAREHMASVRENLDEIGKEVEHAAEGSPAAAADAGFSDPEERAPAPAALEGDNTESQPDNPPVVSDKVGAATDAPARASSESSIS